MFSVMSSLLSMSTLHSGGVRIGSWVGRRSSEPLTNSSVGCVVDYESAEGIQKTNDCESPSSDFDPRRHRDKHEEEERKIAKRVLAAD
jgi:hypothetical protein